MRLLLRDTDVRFGQVKLDLRGVVRVGHGLRSDGGERWGVGASVLAVVELLSHQKIEGGAAQTQNLLQKG